MKIRVSDPKLAASMTGGCTLEVNIGWWTYVPDDESRPVSDGKVFEDNRDALYIPTLQKDGNPVSEEAIAKLKANAQELGFTETSSASGMWILSETSEAQVEFIWILWSSKISEEIRQQLPELAKKIKINTNQDCVAYEVGGKLNFE